MSDEFQSNLLIEASAGTGKTQALANRIIEMLRRGVKPQEIVALTFSRAAAGEIFGRFVTLLAESAKTNPKDAALLRETIATQHLSQIGTLDSFLMRIVRSFPLELGLSGERRILDEHQAAGERQRVSFGILRRTDRDTAKAFRSAFALAMNREDVRSFVETYRVFIKDWHDRYLAEPEASAWGCPETIWGLAPACLKADAATLSEAADRLVGLSPLPIWTDFIEWVRMFRGSFAGVKGVAKKLLELDDLFGEGSIEFRYGNRKEPLSFNATASERIRAAMSLVLGYVLRRKLEMAAGIHALIAEFEKDYARRVRARGALVFSDVPRLICQLDATARLALEFRLDARIRGWALDEFQDTSREQWQALGGLIEEAKQSAGEKSVLVVGDRKQAIYGWRNGDVGIFSGERESGAYATDELKRTYRSGPAVVEAVNRVFVDGRLTEDYPLWQSPHHETARLELDGFVQRVEAGGRTMDAFVAPLANALRAVDPIARGLTTAILVRTNAFGEFLAAELKAQGIANVVWEGESRVLDTPALLAFLDLTVLADHPGDKQAYNHFCASPLAHARFGANLPKAAELSGSLAQDFVSRGLVRVFREWRALLPGDPNHAWSQSVEDRFTDLLRLADRFELEREPGTRLSDFTDYVSVQSRRQVAEAGRIKIMTIHRSKGLGFDYVLLPLYEHEGLPKSPDGPLVGPGWILPDPGSALARHFPQLRQAWERARDRVEQEALCMYYVAMTRAKRAMTIVTFPPSESTRRFSDYVRELPEAIGRPDWYQALTKPGKEAAGTAQDAEAHFVRPRRQSVRRRLPSLGFAAGQSAGDLFVVDGRSSARERGIAIHADYEKIEFDDWLTRPEGFSGLWRERPFEIFDGESWISGRFDRVVFTGEGSERRAVIYDFKTTRNTRRLPESEFDAELRERYRPQLETYRTALSRLTGIPSAHIGLSILLTESRREVSLP